MERSFRSRSEKGATEIAQFPLALYLMFLVLLLPVLNLVTLLIAGGTVYLATNDLAAKAATQPNFAQALNAMAVEAFNFQANTLAQFVKMSPQGGYAGCGNDLCVLATTIGGTGVQSSAPNTTLSSSIDTKANIYEMQVVSSYCVTPLISMASVPLLGSIPGLGQPITLSFAASRPVEDPGGIQTATDTGGGVGAVTPFNRVNATAPGVVPPPTPVTWRTPSIYKQIADAGQTVTSVNVVLVNGWQNWQSSGVNILPGQTAWIDTSAVGTWGFVAAPSGSSPNPEATAVFDASGNPLPGCVPGSCVDYSTRISACGPEYSLIGYAGSSPPAITATPMTLSNPYPAGVFLVGDTLTNYALPGGGQLNFVQNFTDNPDHGGGQQEVRIIVTTPSH